MKHRLVGFIILFFFGISFGCARVEHIPVTSPTDDLKMDGIRYFEASPYLLVYSNLKGGIVTEVLYLPDPNKKMAAKPTSIMASLDTTMNFSKGVLTDAKDIADSTAVPKAVLGAIQTAGEAFIKAMDEASANEYKVPPPHLYKIISTEDGVKFVGGEGNTTINVTLLPQDKEEGKK